MASIAVLLANDFEDSEYTVPVERLRAQGHDVTVLSAEPSGRLTGKRDGTKVEIDDAASNHRAAEFAALLIPGGYSPDQLRLSDDAIRLTREFVETNKPVAAVCHGPQLLISAGVVEGREMTSWPSVRIDLENAGARWVDREVVEDGPFITSRKPDDLEAFSEALIARLGGDA